MPSGCVKAAMTHWGCPAWRLHYTMSGERERKLETIEQHHYIFGFLFGEEWRWKSLTSASPGWVGPSFSANGLWHPDKPFLLEYTGSHFHALWVSKLSAASSTCFVIAPIKALYNHSCYPESTAVARLSQLVWRSLGETHSDLKQAECSVMWPGSSFYLLWFSCTVFHLLVNITVS